MDFSLDEDLERNQISIQRKQNSLPNPIPIFGSFSSLSSDSSLLQEPSKLSSSFLDWLNLPKLTKIPSLSKSSAQKSESELKKIKKQSQNDAWSSLTH